MTSNGSDPIEDITSKCGTLVVVERILNQEGNMSAVQT
jgi:hypothetical protein